MFKIVLPIEARGKQRVRIGKNYRYTPKETVNFESYIKYQCYNEMAGIPMFDEAIVVDILSYREVPKSWSKKKRQEALKGQIYPTSKPDIDNVAKALLDAMNNVVYADDKYITSLNVKKRYAETPSIEIAIYKEKFL
jgi:Holliday junction resolvase RusA-like endonuclease